MNMEMAVTFHYIGCCHFDFRNYEKALNNFYQSLFIKQSATHNVEMDMSIAVTLHYIGRCHLVILISETTKKH